MGNVMYEIQEILAEIRELNEEIMKFDGLLKIPTDDLYERRACQLLHQRMELLLDRLKRFADGNDEV